MLYNLFPQVKQDPKNFMEKIRHTHVHAILAFPVMGLLSLAVGVFTLSLGPEQSASENLAELFMIMPKASAQVPPRLLKDFTSVDVMKLTKDTMTSQLSDAEIKSAVAALSGLKTKYIAISLPMDATVSYPLSARPGPKSAENYTKAWADAAHSAGLKIIWRGTFGGVEGIYNFEKQIGNKKRAPGSALSAGSDTATWLGQTYQYIVSNPDIFADNDIWAPLPERTEGIFQKDTSFLSYEGPGIQQNYVSFFLELKKISDQAFLKINKKVLTGFTSNNFTEVKSGWLHRAYFDGVGLAVIDHYGVTKTPEEMEADIRAIYKKTGKQVFLQEWSDYWNGKMESNARAAYLKSMYAVFQKLADEKILMGFNYWGGWSGGTGEGILERTSAGYTLNPQGKLLAEFFGKNQ